MDDYLGAVFVFVLAVILFIVCVIMMVFFAVYRRTKVVKIANLMFIECTLLGALMVLSSIILWSVYQTKTICTIKSCLGMLGFGVIVGYQYYVHC
jgi:NADH:ubiquinone oxidoreductase subunit 6 (subunit J)